MGAINPGLVDRAIVERLAHRHRILQLTRACFDQAGFIEVETPSVVPSPGLDFHLDAFEVVDSRAARFLTTSPEYQMKRLLASGMGAIYQLCHCFRRDEDGHNHQPEFTMLEWYRTRAGSAELMVDTEQLVAMLATRLHGRSAITRQGRTIDLAPPWPRITVADAFVRYAQTTLESVLPDEERFFRLLVDRVEPQLGRDQPVFLTHYPASMASLAKIHTDDPRYADRFEAYVDGIELCNGFGELTDPVEQRARFSADQASRRAGGKVVYPIDERFLSALDHGLPDSGGNALGFDRMVMLLLGAERIEDVMAFGASRL